MIRVAWYCPKCLARIRLRLPKDRDAVCPRCGEHHEVTPSEMLRSRRTIDTCPLCGCGYFYVDKDFPAWLGGGILLAGAIGFLFTAGRDIRVALGILLGVGLLDALIYPFRPHRTNCYRCLASFTGGVRNPKHGPYDLGTAGRFTSDYEKKRASYRPGEG